MAETRRKLTREFKVAAVRRLHAGRPPQSECADRGRPDTVPTLRSTLLPG